MLEKFLHSILHSILVARGGVQFLLIVSQCTSDICTVTSIQGKDVCCYLHRWSHEFWDHNRQFLAGVQKGNTYEFWFLYFIKISYLKNQWSRFIKMTTTELWWKSVSVVKWMKKGSIFFNEDHFISLTAKKSNTVNCTLNICVEHLFVLWIKKKSFVICIWHNNSFL